MKKFNSETYCGKSLPGGFTFKSITYVSETASCDKFVTNSEGKMKKCKSG